MQVFDLRLRRDITDPAAVAEESSPRRPVCDLVGTRHRVRRPRAAFLGKPGDARRVRRYRQTTSPSSRVPSPPTPSSRAGSSSCPQWRKACSSYDPSSELRRLHERFGSGADPTRWDRTTRVPSRRNILELLPKMGSEQARVSHPCSIVGVWNQGCWTGVWGLRLRRSTPASTP